jgi:hypothetical protein
MTKKKYTLDQLRGAYGAGAACATKRHSGDRVRFHLDKMLGEIWNLTNGPITAEDSSHLNQRWSDLRFCGRLEALLHPYIDGRCRLAPHVHEMFESTEEFIEYWVLWQVISCCEEYAQTSYATPDLSRCARRMARYLRPWGSFLEREPLYTRRSAVSTDSSRIV